MCKARRACGKADSTLRSSRAVPHPSTNRALRRLTSEVGRDPVHSTRYGRQRNYYRPYVILQALPSGRLAASWQQQRCTRTHTHIRTHTPTATRTHAQTRLARTSSSVQGRCAGKRLGFFRTRDSPRSPAQINGPIPQTPDSRTSSGPKTREVESASLADMVRVRRGGVSRGGRAHEREKTLSKLPDTDEFLVALQGNVWQWE